LGVDAREFAGGVWVHTLSLVECDLGDDRPEDWPSLLTIGGMG
jgi:hypothetical protein